MCRNLGGVDFATIALIVVSILAVTNHRPDLFASSLMLLLGHLNSDAILATLERVLMRLLDIYEKYLDTRTRQQ